MKKVTSILCIVFVLIMVLSLPIAAASPYTTYTYSIGGTDLKSPDVYIPDREVTSEYMGLTNTEVISALYPDLDEEEVAAKAVGIKSPTDMVVDEAGNVYIADDGNSRIVVLDRYYKLKFIIDEFKNTQGNGDKLSGPEGVFVTETQLVGTEMVQGRIFVCDTDNSRILTFDHDGNFISEIGEPQGASYEKSGGMYTPIAVAVDRYDRLYIVERGRDAITVMTDEAEFTGFIGGQKVTMSLWEQIWKRFMTEEQQETSDEETTQSTYNNITLSGDFIYATITPADENVVASTITGKDTSGDYAPVKMLNAAGDELMRRNGFYPPSGEVDFATTGVQDEITGVSDIVDVAVGPEKTWSIIDNKRSKVFTYDFDGNLLFAFGDTGDQLGNIPQGKLTDITYQGDAMLLLNYESGSFTVYQRTEYGNVLIQALANQNSRQYDAAIDDWTEILKRNSNFDAAYIGIGNALYRSHQYEEALGYYKSAYDTANYSLAYSELRQEWISTYLWTLPIIVGVICFALVKFFGYAKKVNKRVSVTVGKRTYGQELLFAFHLIFHPFDGFWDLKHEKRGSVRAGTTILVATIAAFYYQSIGQGYVLNPTGTYTSVFGSIIGVCVPLALWIISNWCLTTLFEGEGSFKDIYIASTYSLLPAVLMIIPATIASNFVLASEAKMISLIVTLGFIWLVALIFFGAMVIHDYSIGKNIITTIGTLAGMIVIMFIAILFSTLLGKIVGFITNITTELSFRM